MSDAPPPPPPPAPEPPASGPQVTAFETALRSSDPRDLATIALGFLAFIGSFMPFYHVALMGIGEHANAWHDIDGTGFWGWFGCVVALVGAAVAALPLLKQALPVRQTTATVTVFGLAFLLLFIAIFVNPLSGANTGDACKGDSTGLCRALMGSASIGHAFGFWFAFVLVLVALGFNGYRHLKEIGRL